MTTLDPRRALDDLIRERGETYSSVSRLLSRNSAYVQQFIKRGSPAHLDENDIAQLSVYFGVPPVVFGGEDVPIATGLTTIAIPVLGPIDEDSELARVRLVDEAWMRHVSHKPNGVSVNRRSIGTPYRRAKGTPLQLRGLVDAGRVFRAAGGVGRA